MYGMYGKYVLATITQSNIKFFLNELLNLNP